tara:strand:+ start:157 stop:546 length:390 start_codon:yes stop_codon:yes gene_type:complete
MNLSLCYKNFLIFQFILFFISGTINADEVLDEKINKLTLELRCMTCQNQSIYDSDSEFSKDIKRLIKIKFEEGKTEKEIKKFLVKRYGEYILFKPLFDYKNLFLWAFPFILLVFCLFFIVLRARKNNQN